MKSLQNEGLYLHDKIVKIQINKTIYDAPAKSGILCVKNFNSYESCTKCYAERLFQKNRITFPKLNSKLRTNREFYSQNDKVYHKDISVLCDLKIDFIKSVSLDYMHLMLGFIKRLLAFWVKENQEVRLFKEDIDIINEKLKLIYKSTLYEFSRKSKLITEYDRWKAVELKTFLLYYNG